MVKEQQMITTEIKSICIKEAEKYQLIRSSERIKELDEVFTPCVCVLEILEQLPLDSWNEDKTYLDPTCGGAAFLAAVLIIKIYLGHDPTKALETIYGVDIDELNVTESRTRLLDIMQNIGNTTITDAHIAIVNKNILCRNGLKYDYSFEDSPLESLFEEN